MPSPISTQARAIAYVVKRLHGPMACYPDADFTYYVVPHQNHTVPNEYDVDSFVIEAKKVGGLGSQVIVGC